MSAPLEEYRRKRDFDATPEPAGEAAPAPGQLSYVIQKHAASRLHWDFRIELGGVLLSWAVPKGPSFDPKEKRLAMHVEDHPIEYGGFEGAIPKGEYGGGAVMLWDRGTWEPMVGDANDAVRHIADGHLKMILHGERLAGRWVLVRTRGYGNSKQESWLLIKEHDEAERSHEAFDATAEWMTSVATGRTMEEIAAGAADKVSYAAAPTPAKADPLPKSVDVELATLVEHPPSGDDWLHEPKYDGYRILAFAEGGKVRLLSRTGTDWTKRFGQIATAVGELLGDRTALLDGEAVVMRPDGTTDFQALQNLARKGHSADLHYYVFDLLHLDGTDLRPLPLEVRKRALATLLGSPGENQSAVVRYTDHVIGHGADFYESACRFGLEGVVSKLRTAPHRSGRQRDWRKTKCLLRQEFVVVGFTDPGGVREGFGSLVLAAHDGDSLVHVGRVGSGFSERTLSDLHKRLLPLERTTAPVSNPPTGTDASGLHWVEPQLVADVSFAEWTSEGSLRQPVFVGLRDDKLPGDVVLELPVKLEDATSAAPAPEPEAPASFAGVAITNPGRILWPDVSVTKLQTMRYYESVADLMLPLLANRPLSLVRCPSGYTGECFYQKHIENFPAPVGTVDVFDADAGRTLPSACVDDLAGVVGLVQMGVLELHTWGSRSDKPDSPDRIVFDLDPDEPLAFSAVAATALLLRSELARLGLQSWAKTTGGKGLHVVVPVARRVTWAQAHDFARAFAESIVALDPKLFTASMSKAKRDGRIFIDYVRNSRGATAVAPYSTRARPGAPVAVPLAWEELDGISQRPEFTLLNLHARISAAGFTDPWSDMPSSRQTLTKAIRARLGVD